jgi:hypothetical protein
MLGNHRVDVFDDEDTWGELTSMFEDLANGEFGSLSLGVSMGVRLTERDLQQ